MLTIQIQYGASRVDEYKPKYYFKINGMISINREKYYLH